MALDKKLSSLSIFFPFYNDEGTVQKQIEDAFKIGCRLTEHLEVIAINGGASKDCTFKKIKDMKKKFPSLVIVDKGDNWEGYAVIKYGLQAVTKDWVFYTDGDAQYHLDELPLLVQKQLETGKDVINGYKKSRSDSNIRIILGDLYAKFSNFIFELPIRDTDCDFRLIRRSFLDKITLESHDSSILGEMIKKLEVAGAKFVEIPVSHYSREYGVSNYTPFKLLKEKLIGDIKLYFKMKKVTGKYGGLRIIKFGFVGVSSILLQAGLFNLFILSTSMAPALATILADQFAIVSSFILNNEVTFKDRRHRFRKPIIMANAFAKFYSIVIVSTLIQSLIVWFGNAIFGRSFLIDNTFFIIGLGVTFFWNYKSQKHFVWNKN